MARGKKYFEPVQSFMNNLDNAKSLLHCFSGPDSKNISPEEYYLVISSMLFICQYLKSVMRATTGVSYEEIAKKLSEVSNEKVSS